MGHINVAVFPEKALLRLTLLSNSPARQAQTHAHHRTTGYNSMLVQADAVTRNVTHRT